MAAGAKNGCALRPSGHLLWLLQDLWLVACAVAVAFAFGMYGMLLLLQGMASAFAVAVLWLLLWHLLLLLQGMACGKYVLLFLA